MSLVRLSGLESPVVGIRGLFRILAMMSYLLPFVKVTLQWLR